MPGNPPEKSRFKKGQSGNPEGARRHNQVIKTIKRLTNKQIEEVGSLLLNGTKEEFAALASDPKASMLQQWMAKVVLTGTQKSDYKALQSILDRVAGKVKEKVEHSSDPDAPPTFLPPQVVLMIPDNGRSVRGEKEKK